jgi:hypothetical protein
MLEFEQDGCRQPSASTAAAMARPLEAGEHSRTDLRTPRPLRRPGIKHHTTTRVLL